MNLLQVTTGYLCASFVEENGKVVSCAPILRGKLDYWRTVAVEVKPPVNRLHKPLPCAWCSEIQQERSSIHEFDGGATRAQADALASVERCPDHRQEKKVLALECDLI